MPPDGLLPAHLWQWRPEDMDKFPEEVRSGLKKAYVDARNNYLPKKTFCDRYVKI